MGKRGNVVNGAAPEKSWECHSATKVVEVVNVVQETTL
jgi:hypothetical protein